MVEYVDDDNEITPEGAEFVLDAIGGMLSETNWLDLTAQLMVLVCEDKYDEVDRILAAVDVEGSSIVVFGALIATHPASHHLHEFEPLLIRAAAALDYDSPDDLRREFERR